MIRGITTPPNPLYKIRMMMDDESYIVLQNGSQNHSGAELFWELIFYFLGNYFFFYGFNWNWRGFRWGWASHLFDSEKKLRIELWKAASPPDALGRSAYVVFFLLRSFTVNNNNDNNSNNNNSNNNNNNNNNNSSSSSSSSISSSSSSSSRNNIERMEP